MKIAFMVAGLLVGGCGGDSGGASDTATAAPIATGSKVSRVDPDCPKTGHWSSCLILKRLESSGLAPQRGAEMGDLPAVPVAPDRYTIGNATLAVFVFPDTVARRRAAATLDSARFIPPSRALSTRGEATAIESDNLLALLYSRNEHQRERVSDALTAGPPQP